MQDNDSYYTVAARAICSLTLTHPSAVKKYPACTLFLIDFALFPSSFPWISSYSHSSLVTCLQRHSQGIKKLSWCWQTHAMRLEASQGHQT